MVIYHWQTLSNPGSMITYLSYSSRASSAYKSLTFVMEVTALHDACVTSRAHSAQLCSHGFATLVRMSAIWWVKRSCRTVGLCMLPLQSVEINFTHEIPTVAIPLAF